MRIGIGLDSHSFLKEKINKQFVIGGVAVPDTPGMDADSDGDVVLHALVNALSSAIGGPSLDFYAKDLCKKRGITDSSEYVKEAMKAVKAKGFGIENVSIAIECAKPKIEPISAQMKKKVAALLNVDENAVGITATSGKGLTAFGRGEGINCYAVVLLESLR